MKKLSKINAKLICDAYNIFYLPIIFILLSRLFYFYIDLSKEIWRGAFKKSDKNYLNFSLLFGLIPFLIYTVFQENNGVFIVLGLYTLLFLNLFYAYKSSIINFVINSLFFLVYLEVMYFYDGNFVLYGLLFSGIGIFINNVIYNKDGIRDVFKLTTFNFYYITSGFLKIFDGVTSKINKFSIFFPVAYIFVIIEIYVTNGITFLSNFLTNGLLDEIVKFDTLNKGLYIYSIIFYIKL